MVSDVPEVHIERQRKPALRRVSFVWLIPVIALAIALGVAWNNYATRGPVITLEFQNGAGIAKDETVLKYRDITVGVVEDVGFSDGLNTVLVTVRVDKDVAPYIDSGANFWVVRPELTARGVSGLDTVLSGVFIEGVWDNEIGAFESRFMGLDNPPLFRPARPGLEIALRATANGQLTENAPLFYKGIEVGRVGKARISPANNFAIAEAIIYEPHGRLINNSTRFWDISGFSVNIGVTGAEIDFTSLATLISGGIAFDTVVSGGAPITDGEVFFIYEDELQARNSVFNASEVEPLELSAVFEDNIAGLTVGADVELAGLKIGEVQSISGVIDRATYGDSRVRLNAILSIQPSRLGLEVEPSPAAALNFMAGRVREGLRARLTSAGLLTGGLKVELVRVGEEGTELIPDMTAALPVIPTADSQMGDAGASVEGVITRLNGLPIEELMASAIDFLDTAQNFVASDALNGVPEEAVGLLEDVRGLVGSDEVQNVPVLLNSTLTRLEAMMTELEEEQLVARLLGAVDAAAAAAEGVDVAVEGVPELISELQSVAAKAEGLALEELVEEITRLAGSAAGFVGTEAFTALPADLSAALAVLQATLSDVREGGVIENANAALASARSAADAVALAADDLPALVTRMSGVLDQAARTIRGYDQGQELGRDVEDTLREIQEAAQALASLAKTIERNPSALIRGR